MTLYEITSKLLELEEIAETEEVSEDVLRDTFEALEGEFEYKADQYAKVMRGLSAQAEAIKTEKDRLDKRQKACEKNAERMKGVLAQAMKAAGKSKFKTDFFTFSMRATPPKVVVDDEEAIPFIYFTVPDPVINKTKIRDALKIGVMIEGAHLETGETLVIK